MGLVDLVVWNDTNNVVDGSDEANGIELMEWKGVIDGINETHGIDGMETRKEC